jgi:hypothetical protein
MAPSRIPNPVAVVVGQVLGAHYYNHRRLNNLFVEKGAPGERPEGNCEDKCIEWLKRASTDESVDAFSVLGGVLEEFMEVDRPPIGTSEKALEQSRQRVRDALAKFGLSYHTGGRIIGANAGAPTRSLESILRARDLTALETEFDRALGTIELDPAAAVTAACATIESLCRVYIEDEGLAMPSDQSIKPLWRVVQAGLGLDPSQIADDDLKRILSGLTSIVDGLGAFRTHVGSAHGRGRTAYRPSPRHARLAVHSAHTLAVFVVETWDARAAGGLTG